MKTFEQLWTAEQARLREALVGEKVSLGTIQPDRVAHAEERVRQVEKLRGDLRLQLELKTAELRAAREHAGDAAVDARLGCGDQKVAQEMESTAHCLQDEVARLNLQIEAAGRSHKAALESLEREKVTALRETAAAKRAEAAAIQERTRPLLEEIARIEGVPYTFEVLSRLPRDGASVRLLREAEAAERQARNQEQTRRFADARQLQGVSP